MTVHPLVLGASLTQARTRAPAQTPEPAWGWALGNAVLGRPLSGSPPGPGQAQGRALRGACAWDAHQNFARIQSECYYCVTRTRKLKGEGLTDAEAREIFCFFKQGLSVTAFALLL